MRNLELAVLKNVCVIGNSQSKFDLSSVSTAAACSPYRARITKIAYRLQGPQVNILASGIVSSTPVAPKAAMIFLLIYIPNIGSQFSEEVVIVSRQPQLKDVEEGEESR